ncbi:hypothetical protein ISS85_02315 [Candidatus Microgenomates bacterium]|nr:hypothetical protein [Candidatus Microgenomates bacterium]
MGEGEIGNESRDVRSRIKKLIQRHQPSQEQAKKELTPAEAVEHFITRLEGSQNGAVKAFGDWARIDLERLAKGLEEAKRTEPSLTALEFLERKSSRGTHLIAGRGWEPTPAQRQNPRERSTVSNDTIIEILNNPTQGFHETFPSINRDAPEDRDDYGFAFTKQGDFGPTSEARGMAKMKAQRAWIGGSEKPAEMNVAIRTDVGPDFFIGDGATVGMAVEIPNATVAEFLSQG